ncbi:MAG: terminase large subunit domain-containing protein [Puniceicoccales bacterium]
MTPFFLPYQQRWINDRAPIKIMEKARQIGISWATAYACVRRCSQSSERLDAWISSRDEVQAKLFLEDCRRFAETLNLAATAYQKPVLRDDSRSNTHVLELASGPRIHSLTSNADAQAGKRGTRVLDEFALHRDPRQLYAIAYPGVTWGGQLELISTHRGAENFFNKLIEEARHGGNPKNISLHRVTLEDALAQGFLKRLKQRLPAEDQRQQMDEADYFNFVRQSCADEESFRQEYCCVPADDATAFLPWELIAAAEYAPHEAWELGGSEIRQTPSAHYLGVDIGRDHDLTVFWLIEQIGQYAFSRKVICIAERPFSEQEEILYELMHLPGLRRVCIDQTGLGRQFAERAIERFGRHRVEGITFTAPVKEDLAYPLRRAFEDRTIRIPADKHIRADLRAVRKEHTSAGNIRFSAERGPSGHADRFWALALALHAARNPTPPPHLEPLSRQRKR